MKDRVNKKRTENFTTTSNKILQDSRLSYEAIGVFMYLWSMPDDWQVMVKQVMKHNNSSEYKVRQALRELRDFGYMKWTRTQGYFIYDICEDGTFHCGDIQHNEIHYSDNQHNDIYIQNNNINKTITSTKDASAFSSQGSYSEIPNNSTGAKNAQPQKQMDKDFEEFWEEFGNKVKRKDAVAKYKVATSKATHAEIMAGVRRYKEYLKIATWLQIQTPCVWLNAERWNDNFDELTKQECTKQGKPLPIAQKTPEKQQEEVKMKEDTQRKRESVIQGLKAEEVEFMEHIKQVLKTNFDARFHKDWIDNLIFSLRNKVAYFGFTEQKHINAVQYNLEKFKGHVMRELSTFKDFEVEKIELKLINF